MNTLRVWCQWDFEPPRTFADVSPENTMYTEEGDVRAGPFQTLAAIIEAADTLDMVIEVTLFSQEKRNNLPVPAQERAARKMAERLFPYRTPTSARSTGRCSTICAITSAGDIEIWLRSQSAGHTERAGGTHTLSQESINAYNN